jgi:hypothetical protein
MLCWMAARSTTQSKDCSAGFGLPLLQVGKYEGALRTVKARQVAAAAATAAAAPNTPTTQDVAAAAQAAAAAKAAATAQPEHKLALARM